MPETIQKTAVQFKEVNSTTVFISETKANYADSKALLEKNSLRLMAYKEALVLIDKNPELKEQLKGKWFYLAGKGLEESEFHTFDNEGKLTKGKGDIEKTVYLWNGKNPLSLGVHAGGSARFGERRFLLNANSGPQGVAPVVVGVRAGHEVAAPKIEASGGAKFTPELKEKFRTTVAKVDGVLAPELTDVLKEALRAME